MLGLGCTCAGACGKGQGVDLSAGSSGSFGYAMSADGVPISKDLPGYQAVSGSIPGFNAPMDPAAAAGPGDGFPGFLTETVLGCPAWVWLVAGAVVLMERKGRR